MNVVIYARFSSHSQTEQSIEGQLKVCNEYAAANNYVVVGEYIDRAQSGTTDNRTEFQRMIADSDRHTFEGVFHKIQIIDKLKEKKIYVRYWNKARINNRLRITIGTDEQMQQLIEALKEIV